MSAIPCPKCDELMASAEGLSSHMIEEHGAEPPSTTPPPTPSPSEIEAKRRAMQKVREAPVREGIEDANHIVDFYCETCGAIWGFVRDPKAAVRQVTAKCEECLKDADSFPPTTPPPPPNPPEEGQEGFEKLSVVKENTIYRCQKCGQNCVGEEALRWHPETCGHVPEAMRHTLDATLQSRRARYGDFTSEANVAECLRESLNRGARVNDLTDVQRHALHMICTKMARIVNGDANHADSWLDIQGYAKLAEERAGGGS